MQRGGCLMAAGAIGAGVWAEPARAEDEALHTLQNAIVTAFANLDRHEIATLALMLGLLLFTVVTAIMLVRTRAARPS